jgi:hypothetical protein
VAALVLAVGAAAIVAGIQLKQWRARPFGGDRACAATAVTRH